MRTRATRRTRHRRAWQALAAGLLLFAALQGGLAWAVEQAGPYLRDPVYADRAVRRPLPQLGINQTLSRTCAGTAISQASASCGSNESRATSTRVVSPRAQPRSITSSSVVAS